MSWYRMHREWMEDRLWRYEKYSKREAWCWLIENAKFDDYKDFIKGEKVIIPRGSLVQTERQLAKKWKWGRQKVRTFLKTLEKDEKIVVNLTQKLTQISIMNYSTYQETQPNEKPAGNPAVTQEQPSLKESKELKNGKWQLFLRCCTLVGIDPERNIRAANQSEKCLNNWLDHGLDEQIIFEVINRIVERNKKTDKNFSPNTLKYFDDAMTEEIKAGCGNDDDEWIERMELYKKGKWLKSWGPEPDQIDTNVPNHLKTT